MKFDFDADQLPNLIKASKRKFVIGTLALALVMLISLQLIELKDWTWSLGLLAFIIAVNYGLHQIAIRDLKRLADFNVRLTSNYVTLYVRDKAIRHIPNKEIINVFSRGNSIVVKTLTNRTLGIAINNRLTDSKTLLKELNLIAEKNADNNH